MPKDLTASQAIKAAMELQASFNRHEMMRTRRSIRAREVEPDLEALGLSPKLQDLITWQTEEPNQEASRYATAFSTAEPQVAVFLETEKPEKQKLGETLEGWYGGSLETLYPDFYPYDLHMTADGFAVGRLDLKPAFWSGIPARKDLESEEFNSKVDDHRKLIGLPFEMVLVDPATFYYDEDKKREKIIVGVEVGSRRESVVREAYEKFKRKGRRKRTDPEKFLNPTVPDTAIQSGKLVNYVVLRTAGISYHMLIGDSKADQEILWEGPSDYPDHTGYILWRGRYTGLDNVERKYDPFILASLNAAQIKSLFVTLQADFAVQAAQTWLEREQSKGAPTVSRAITSAAKTSGAAKRTDKGRAATLEEGARVRYREVAGDMAAVLARIEGEEERNRFSDALMGEAAASATGRAIIRMQEAAGRLLRQGFKAKQLACEETLSVIRRTIYGNPKKFIPDGRHIYVPRLLEGVGDDGRLLKREILSIGEEHNIPHSIKVKVASMSQAAQLALHEEGLKLSQTLSHDTLDEDFHGVKNIPLENRRRVKDRVRESTIPVVVKRAVEDVLAAIVARGPSRKDVILPDPGESSREVTRTGGGQPPGVSGKPTPVSIEDSGLSLGAEGGTQPLA